MYVVQYLACQRLLSIIGFFFDSVRVPSFRIPIGYGEAGKIKCASQY